MKKRDERPRTVEREPRAKTMPDRENKLREAEALA